MSQAHDAYALLTDDEKATYERRTETAGTHETDTGGSDTGDTKPPEIAWGEPLPLITTAAPLPYPFESLPLIIRNAVKDVRQATQAPGAMVASCALAAASLACQGICNVQRAANLTGPVNLLFLSIADSGERKSSVDSFFMRGIREYEANARRDAKPDLDQYRADEKTWAAEVRGIEGVIQKQAKNGSPSSDLKERLKILETTRPEPPKVPRLIYSDVTMEALAGGLAKWSSAGVFSSEGGSFFGSYGMGKDSSMRTVSLFNQQWDALPVTFDRRSCESIALVNTRLTISLMVQESTFRSYIDQNGNGDFLRGSGFLARFLICWPESTQGTRLFCDTPETLTGLETFKSRVIDLLKQTTVNNDGLALSLLKLCPEAFSEWKTFHDEVEKGLVADGEFSEVRDTAAKCADNAARLAAIFHLFKGGDGDISIESMRGACDVAVWHLSESRRFFGALALPPKIADAAKLETWLIERCRKEKTGFLSTGEAIQYGPSHLRTAEKIHGVLEYLAELDRARVISEGKRKLICINPEVLNPKVAK